MTEQYTPTLDSALQTTVQAFAAGQRATFDAWLATADFDILIEGALEAAQDAYDQSEHVEEDVPQDTNLLFRLDEHRSKNLVQALADRKIGHVDIDLDSYAWTISFRDVIRRNRDKATYAQRYAVLTAFAHALCEPGFVFEIDRF